MQKEVNVSLGLDLVPYITQEFLDSLSKKCSDLGKVFRFHFEDDMSLKPNECSLEIGGCKSTFVFEKPFGGETLMTELVSILHNGSLLKPVC